MITNNDTLKGIQQVDRFLERLLIVVLTLGFVILLTHFVGWWGDETNVKPCNPDTIPAQSQPSVPMESAPVMQVPKLSRHSDYNNLTHLSKMVRLTSTAPINIECERSINDEQAKFVKSNVKRVKAFEKDFNVYITIAKNEMGTLTLKVGRSTEKCDAKAIEEEMENIMDQLILWIEKSIADEKSKENEESENQPEQKDPEGKNDTGLNTDEEEFIVIHDIGNGLEIFGNMNPMKALHFLRLMTFKMLYEQD